METEIRRLKDDIVCACRILDRERLIQGFGHVSCRIPGTDRFLLTPRVSLALVGAEDLLTIDLTGKVVEGRHAPPFEAPLHLAIFQTMPRVGAIARVHARVANMFSVTDRPLVPVHNHGSFFSGGVPVFPKPDLISTPQLGREVAEALGDRPAVLLRGNGQVTVGATVPEAVMMAIYLEEAAEILFGALQIGAPARLTGDEAAARRVEALPPVDLERAWNYFKHRSGCS
ncbi:MAG TPA: class II aldolase/adducin family protein [candidate division Zixibacteria bacterium]|nr:class II aldolase/adducin family protein [candidate division Zixibacteria bacterium]